MCVSLLSALPGVRVRVGASSVCACVRRGWWFSSLQPNKAFLEPLLLRLLHCARACVCVSVCVCPSYPHPTRYPDTMRSENLRLNWIEPALVAAFRSSGT